jgi:hypothetical protein
MNKEKYVQHFFDVSLTLHLSITLDQLDAQIFNTFITFPYMCMLRAISCAFSGGQIVLMQHLVSSLSVSDCPVHLCTGQSLTESDDTRCCIKTIWPPEDEQDIARSMYM